MDAAKTAVEDQGFMAESDPRKSRAYAKRAQVPDQSEEDPLVELARIVGEDNHYSTASGNRAKSVQDDGQAPNALSTNLETELLSELEISLSRGNPEPASASARRQIIRPSSQSQPQPQPQPEPDDGDELMRSIEEQLGAFERRQLSARPVSEAPSHSHWSSRTEQLRGGQLERQAPDPDAVRRQEQDPPRTPASRPSYRGQQGPVLRAAAAPDPGAIQGGIRTEQSAPYGAQHRSRGEPDFDEPSPASSAQRRSRVETFAPPPRQVSLRPDRPVQPAGRPAPVTSWNGTGDADDGQDATDAHWNAGAAAGAGGLRTTFDKIEASDGHKPSPSAAARSAHIEAELSRELESGYSDPTASGNWPEPDPQSGTHAMHAAGAANYDTDPAPKQSRRRRSRRGLLVLASLLGLALAGGGVAAYLRGGEPAPSGPPPVIAAPQGAVKIQPPAPQQQAAEETVGEAVYNRVAGAAQPTQEQVVEGAEEPEEISRIVLPPPEPPAPVADAAAPEGAAVPPADAPEGEPNAGPRRVRTYVVRPDGTIVASEEVPGASEPAAAEPAAGEPVEQQVAAVEAERPSEPTTVPVTEINEADQPDADVSAAESSVAEAPGAPTSTGQPSTGP
jgi:hypothetical protein